MIFYDNNGHLHSISVYNWDYSEIEKHAKNKNMQKMHLVNFYQLDEFIDRHSYI